MKLERIIYLDNYIKIFCAKTERKESETITPALIQYITLSYSIGLINNPVRKVKEQIKIDKKHINFIDNYIVISFKITGLLNPNNCELTLKTFNIYLKNSLRFTKSINKTHSFKIIQSATSPIQERIRASKPSKNSIEKLPKKAAEQQVKIQAKKEIRKTNDPSTPAHFTDPFEKFKEKLQDTDFLELLRRKAGSIEFNLKNFGISLLCKLLLLVKYINELVDNEFQNDLQEFLKKNILESIKEEAPA